jgi:hypothetical protein
MQSQVWPTYVGVSVNLYNLLVSRGDVGMIDTRLITMVTGWMREG